MSLTLYYHPLSSYCHKALVGRYGAKIQSVYAAGRVSQTQVAGRELEPLARAQNPLVDWRPDGVDVLAAIGDL